MRTTILGIPIDWISKEQLRPVLQQLLLEPTPHQITTVNPEFVELAQRDPEYRSILQNSALSIPDGTGIVLAQTFADTHPPDSLIMRWLLYIKLGIRHIFYPLTFRYKRITGIELVGELLALSDAGDATIFLLGAAPGVAGKAAQAWKHPYPKAKIVGVSSANPNDAHIIEEIRRVQPDILLVAYGTPKQERFIAQHAAELQVPIMVGVGGAFDYAAGNIYLAPQFIRTLGLEWLVRLIQQPERFGRIYRSVWTFSQFVVKNTRAKQSPPNI